MLCHTLCWMSVFIIFGCSVYGDNGIEQRDQGVARAVNLESHLIFKLFSNMENDVKGLRDEIKELQAKIEEKPKTIYAQVQLLGEKKMSPGQRVKFTTTVANIGHAYKTSQGFFEAPYDGTYLFTANLCMKGENWLVFRIVQDYKHLSEGHPGDTLWHACASATTVTYMRAGSKVWAEIDRIGGGVLSSSYGISSFTGVFLNDFQKP